MRSVECSRHSPALILRDRTGWAWVIHRAPGRRNSGTPHRCRFHSRSWVPLFYLCEPSRRDLRLNLLRDQDNLQMLTTLTEAVCPSDLEDCAPTYRESRVALFARRKARPAIFHLFYRVQRAYCGPSIFMSGARSPASRVCPRNLDRHFHLPPKALSSCHRSPPMPKWQTGIPKCSIPANWLATVW
jgi:hypothetical protein